MADVLDRVRGYCNTFNEWCSPIGDDEIRALILPGAFGSSLSATIAATILHNECTQVATTWDRSLRLWQDNVGLACEFDVAATSRGVGIRDMVASGFCGMSIGLTILKSKCEIIDRVPHHTVSRAAIDHATICNQGAFPSAQCWLASTPADRLPPIARRWRLGKIAHEQNRAADREIAARAGASARGAGAYALGKRNKHIIEMAYIAGLHRAYEKGLTCRRS